MDKRQAKKILNEIKEKSIVLGDADIKDFSQQVVEQIFLKEMEYGEKESLIYKGQSSLYYIQKGVLLLKGTVEQSADKELLRFVHQLDREKIEWGIMIHPTGMWLLNTKIDTNSFDKFTDDKVVLEIRYGQNKDQKYFCYFSKDNLIGNDRNAYYFKDIIVYKNIKYKGNSGSWSGYASTLKRFLDYIAQTGLDYEAEENNVYDKIKFAYFQEYIQNGTKSKTVNSVRNAFFHIKEFMCTMTENPEFDKSIEQLFDVFKDYSEPRKMTSIMDVSKIKKALRFLEGRKNGLRNKVVLLFLLAYGLERRKICALEWKANIKGKALKMNEKIYPMPSYLYETLENLREETKDVQYIFSNDNGKKLNEGTFNTILSGISEVDLNDDLFTQFTPVNIRKSVAKYLLKNGCSLEKIFYLMDMDVTKMNRYFTYEELENAAKLRYRKLDFFMEEHHPLEDFFEQLR